MVKNRKKYHVSPHDDGWQVKMEGGKRATEVFETKDMAVDEAQNLAKEQEPSQILIHGQDGKIKEERTYGQDPKRTKG